jgi:hypothetical protein
VAFKVPGISTSKNCSVEAGAAMPTTLALSESGNRNFCLEPGARDSSNFVRSKSSNLADFDRLGEMSFSEFAANTLRDRDLFPPSIKIIQVHELNQSSLTSAFLQSKLQASHNELLEQAAANCVTSRRRLRKADDICNS